MEKKLEKYGSLQLINLNEKLILVLNAFVVHE